jgi:hypothetical protein
MKPPLDPIVVVHNAGCAYLKATPAPSAVVKLSFITAKKTFSGCG